MHRFDFARVHVLLLFLLPFSSCNKKILYGMWNDIENCDRLLGAIDVVVLLSAALLWVCKVYYCFSRKENDAPLL